MKPFSIQPMNNKEALKFLTCNHCVVDVTGIKGPVFFRKYYPILLAQGLLWQTILPDR